MCLGAPFQIKSCWGIIEVGFYGSISRLQFEFPLDNLGILVQLDLENPLRKNLSPGARV